MKVLTLPQGYERRVPLDLSTPCWPWPGFREEHGYARIMVDGKILYVHRLTYSLHVGPIPRGWEIDHACHTQALAEDRCEGGTCRHRGCWNPAHLEAVTSLENAARGNHPIFSRTRQTRCARGHDLTDPANVYTRKNGRRRCRACQRLTQKRRRASSKRSR